MAYHSISVLKEMTSVGDEETFPHLKHFFGWPNNQKDMRQISKRKMTKFNYVHMYGNSTYMRDSDAVCYNEVYMTFRAKDEVRPLGVSEERKSLQDKMSRCSVIRCLPCYVDGGEKVSAIIMG